MVAAIFGFALATAYVPWITGAAATPRWCVLVALAAWALVFLPRVRWRTAPVAWGCVFLAWAWLSMAWSPAFEAKDQAWKLALYAALFMAGGQMASLRPLYCGAAAGLAVNGLIVLADLAGLISYQQVGPPSGLFVNGLYLAEFAAMVMAGLIGTGLWRWAVVCAPCVLLVALARGPILAFGAACAARYLSDQPRRWPVIAAGALVALALLAVARPSTVIDRFNIWGDLIASLNVLGHGLGAYWGDAPLISVLVDAAANRKPHASNDLLEIAYDLGAVGVIAAVGFIWSVMRGPMTAERLVILVFIVEGAFGFPFFLPWSAGLFCLAAGHIARRGDLRVPAAVPRRIPIRSGHVRNFGPIVSRSSD